MKKTCPFCLMMRRAIRNAVVGMTLSASFLVAGFYAYRNISGI